MNITKSIFAVLALTGALVAGSPAISAEGHGGTVEPALQSWTFSGLFGKYDQAQLQRGFQIYREVCASCHSAKYFKFRMLSAPGGPGYSEEQVKLLASEFTVTDSEATDGERAAVAADAWPSPFASEQDARDANGGALPPDFSVLAKARGIAKPFPGWVFNYFTGYSEGGPDYIYNLLVNYHDEAPEGVEIPEGKYYNAFFAGNAISMAPPLSDELITYPEGVPMTMDQYAKDVSAFMMWLAEPDLASRKEMGFKVLIFLALFAALMYLTKRKIWAKAH